MKRRYDNERVNARIANLQTMAELNQQIYGPSSSFERYSPDVVRKAKKRLDPDPALETKFADFLKLPKTGIVRLLPHQPCSEESSMDISEVLGKCPSRLISGGAQYFSFRKRDYVHSTWADVGFTDNWIFSLGTLNQGILVNIGDVDLEKVTNQTNGVTFLADFVPATDVASADKQNKELKEGIQNGDLIYKHVFPIEVDKTFIARIVAYKADYVRTLQIGGRKFELHPLEGDNRVDIIVAFRIIGRATDGSITLLWREIMQKPSPKLTIPKSQ